MFLPFAYHNGAIKKFNEIAIPANDLALLRGYGIFDFFKSKNGVPLFIDDYLNRFFNSAQEMGLELFESKAEIVQIIKDLQEVNGFGNYGFRLVLTGGASWDGFLPGKPNFFILQENLPQNKPELLEKGARLISYEFQREAPEIKSINYQLPVRLKLKGQFQDALDVLYYSQNQVFESSRCNFYLIKNGIIHTQKDGILQGITRKKVLSLAGNEFQFALGPIYFDQLAIADEAFITSTTKGVQPIHIVDSKIIGKGTTGPITQKLMQAFNSLVDSFTHESSNIHLN